MGEIAEATINGFCCSECGEVMGDFAEPGYPRTCRTCRKRAKRQRDPNAPFICNSSRALTALRFWLRDRPPFTSANDRVERRGMPAITLGGPICAGVIICPDEATRQRAMEHVEVALYRRKPNGGREP